MSSKYNGAVQTLTKCSLSANTHYSVVNHETENLSVDVRASYLQKVLKSSAFISKFCFNWLLQNIYAWNFTESMGSTLPKSPLNPPKP